MKKTVSIFLALFLVLLPFPVHAEELLVLVAESCEKDGELYECDGEYLKLNDDGTGTVSFNGTEYSITWDDSGAFFQFQDEAGQSMMDGVVGTDGISGTYRGYRYTYVLETAQTQTNQTPVEWEPSNVDVSQVRTYYPVSCTKDGESFPFSGEYIVLDPDGTGMVVFNGCAYSLVWSGGNGEPFAFTDSLGNTFDGTLNGDMLEGAWHGFTYTFRQGPDAPVMALDAGSWGAGLPYILDQADLLSDSEEASLSAKMEEYANAYGCAIYIVTVDDMQNFSFYGRTAGWDENNAFYAESGSSSGSLAPVEMLAEEIRTGYSLGYGPDQDTVLLLLSMADRDFDLVAYGDFGNASFTDYGKEYLQKQFLDDFKEDDWYAGFLDYVETSGQMLELSSQGKPVDVGRTPVNPAWSLILSFLLAALIAWIVCCLLKRSMRKTEEKKEAVEYVQQDGTEITVRSDTYRTTAVSRVYDPPKRSSSGGTSHSSSGHSHSSGKF